MSFKGSPVSSKLLICIENWNINVSTQRHQYCSHTSMFTVFRPSDDRVLLTMYSAELK